MSAAICRTRGLTLVVVSGLLRAVAAVLGRGGKGRGVVSLHGDTASMQTCAIVFTNVSRLYIRGVFRPKNQNPSLLPPPPSTSPLHPLVDPPTIGRGQKNPHQPSSCKAPLRPPAVGRERRRASSLTASAGPGRARLALSLGACLIALLAASSARAAEAVKLQASFTPDRLGASTTIGFGFTISNTEGGLP